MLVLTRSPKTVAFPDSHDTIVIGDNIRIVLLRARDGRVRIGIECPKDMPILRSELIKRKEGEA